tara:strand:- start:1424 stop:1747 length:324 start_codon:yes stop_codon:yes gene_type:complete
LISSYGLECASGKLNSCQGKAEQCKKKAGSYLGKKYKTCPVSELMSDKRILYCLQLERESAVHPVTGWPDNYAAWVVDISCEISGARSKREAGEYEKMRKQAKAGSG